MVSLFIITLFLSAVLLFWVEPMFGKMVLPLLGSSPNVWNTCMVFYQAALLLGYIYAHFSTVLLGVKWQSILHVILLVLAFFLLPIHIPSGWSPPVIDNPIPWILLLLTVSIGLPFFILSSTAPLLQKWFANTKHPAAKDPYFLYVSSNCGSMVVLFAYPFLIEPSLRLVEQSNLWFYFYCLFVVFVIFCAVMLWKSFNTVSQIESNNDQNIKQSISFNQRIKWILLAFVPSSLMLGVTTYISIDISPMPLFWIIPLAIYLLTFIFVFARNPILPHSIMVKAMPYVVLGAFVYLTFGKTSDILFIFLLHLIVFFVCAMVCHGELVITRPQTAYLTEFYIWVSVGGFLGGVFNTLISPLVFKEVVEYPLAIVLACLLKPTLVKGEQQKNDFFYTLALAAVPGIVAVVLKLVLKDLGISEPISVVNSIIYGIPAIICLKAVNNPIRFGLSVGAIILVYVFYMGGSEKNLFIERNFFGVHRIKTYGDNLNLYQDTTLHGTQRISEKDDCIPLSYYHETSPIGQLFRAFVNDKKKFKVAAVGLGAGSVACYGRKGDEWIFYEIDPTIVRINQEGEYFTYLNNSSPEVYVVFGDGRLSLQRAPNKYFNFIILDAFSSDAIPTHLITKEAMKVYLKKLARGGILAFHTSNRHLDLPLVLGNIASHMKLTAIIQNDYEYGYPGKSSSEWVLVTRKKEDLKRIVSDSRWKQLNNNPTVSIWTDDYSDIFSIFKWQKG